MPETRPLLERVMERVELRPFTLDGFHDRRDRRRRNQRITAGVVGIAIFVTAVWIVTTGGSFNRTQQPAVQPTPTPPAGTALDYLIDLNTGEMTQLPKSIAGTGLSGGYGYAVSPDGTKVAYTSQDDARTAQVFIASLDGRDVQQVTHEQRGAWGPDWSPDGAAIAYTSVDGDVNNISNVFVLDLATGETSQVTNEKPPTEACLRCAPLGAALPRFSPDGASIVYERSTAFETFSVRIVPVTGGKSVLLVDQADGGTLSPDGSTLASTCYDPGLNFRICIAHADGTNLRVLVRRPSIGPMWSPDGTRIAYINAENSPHDKVIVMDVATGETTFVADGTVAHWLDDHTLIIERFH